MRGWSGTGTSCWVNRHAIATLPLWPGQDTQQHTVRTLKPHTDTHTHHTHGWTHKSFSVHLTCPQGLGQLELQIWLKSDKVGIKKRLHCLYLSIEKYYPLTFKADLVSVKQKKESASWLEGLYWRQGADQTGPASANGTAAVALSAAVEPCTNFRNSQHVPDLRSLYPVGLFVKLRMTAEYQITQQIRPTARAAWLFTQQIYGAAQAAGWSRTLFLENDTEGARL